MSDDQRKLVVNILRASGQPEAAELVNSVMGVLEGPTPPDDPQPVPGRELGAAAPQGKEPLTIERVKEMSAEDLVDRMDEVHRLFTPAAPVTSAFLPGEAA